MTMGEDYVPHLLSQFPPIPEKAMHDNIGTQANILSSLLKNERFNKMHLYV